jgi:hypothetical protein
MATYVQTAVGKDPSPVGLRVALNADREPHGAKRGRERRAS